MRVLLDECVPKALAREFAGHTVSTVPHMGWAGLRNGPLLARMQAERFEAFVTVDQNLRYQQNLRQAGITVVVMKAVSNSVDDLRPLVEPALKSLKASKSGDLIEVKP